MSQEAAEAPPTAPPDGHDAVGDHPDAAPRLATEIEQQEAAATKIREMIDEADAADEAERAAQEAAATGEPQGNTEEPIPEGEQEGAEAEGDAEGDESEHQDTDEEAAAKQKREEKPSNVREAMRRQRAARKDRAELKRERDEFTQQQEQFQQQQTDFQSFMQKFQADPIGSLSRHLNLPPEELLAQQADAQVNQVPPAVQAQIDAQAREFAEYKAGVEAEKAERAKVKSAQEYDDAVAGDVARIAGAAEHDSPERFPYYLSLSKPTRERRARAILQYTVEHMPDPKQYGPDDLLEVLDEQAKEDDTSLQSSKLLKRSKADPGQGTRPAEGKPPRRRRRGGPSARRAAEPAAPRAPKTEAEAVEAAAAEVRRLHKQDAEVRDK